MRKPVFHVDPSIISRLLIGSSNEVPMLLVVQKFCSTQTDKTPDYSNPLLRLRGRG